MNDLLRKRYFGQLLRSISLKRTTIGLNRSKYLTQIIASSLRPSFSDRLLGACPGMNDLLRKRYFGQLLRSILPTINNYFPQLIEISEAARPAQKYHVLGTTLTLGQAPGQ